MIDFLPIKNGWINTCGSAAGGKESTLVWLDEVDFYNRTLPNWIIFLYLHFYSAWTTIFTLFLIKPIIPIMLWNFCRISYAISAIARFLKNNNKINISLSWYTETSKCKNSILKMWEKIQLRASGRDSEERWKENFILSPLFFLFIVRY